MDRGAICEVLGSNFKDYVIVLHKMEDEVVAMDDAGTVCVYNISCLKFMSNNDIDSPLETIRKVLISDDNYKKNQNRIIRRSDTLSLPNRDASI